MKCTHCNGEHPADFKFCPVTGKEIEQPFKACTNPECVDFNKHTLPPDALFCPRCGIKIDDFRVIHTKNVLETNEDNDNRIIDVFFPVNGVILGEQCEFAPDQFLNYKYDVDADENLYQRCEFKQGGGCSYDYSRGYFSELWIEKRHGMFSEWVAKGFDMELSYDSWCELLLKYGFQFEPFKIDYERHTQTLIAIASDNSFRFELAFRFVDVHTGRKYYKDSCGTLGYIYATIDEIS